MRVCHEGEDAALGTGPRGRRIATRLERHAVLGGSHRLFGVPAVPGDAAAAAGTPAAHDYTMHPTRLASDWPEPRRLQAPDFPLPYPLRSAVGASPVRWPPHPSSDRSQQTGVRSRRRGYGFDGRLPGEGGAAVRGACRRAHARGGCAGWWGSTQAGSPRGLRRPLALSRSVTARAKPEATRLVAPRDCFGRYAPSQ